MQVFDAQKMQQALFCYYCEFDAEGLIAAFHVPDQQPEEGIIKNFLSTKIRPSVFPSLLEARAGSVEAKPHPGNWHAYIAEWAAALRTVRQAKGSYRIIELGCGWGCWMANMGVAARSQGLAVDLIGIEADRYHLSSAEETLRLNGFSDRQFTLHHGVAGPRSGKAVFPIHGNDGSHWGGKPIFDPTPEQLARRDVQVLDCITLADMSRGKPVDLLHIDVQGGEYDYVLGSAEMIAKHVRRVLIGTHSRAIEGDLSTHFLESGWRLEMERPAIAPPVNGQPKTRVDGVQMWANPAQIG